MTAPATPSAAATPAAPGLLRALEALAEPSRLRLLRLLDLEELSVGELAECTGLPQSSVSRHLAALRAAGFADERSEGVRTMARRAESPSPAAAALLAPVLEAVRAPTFGHDEDVAALGRVRRARDAGRDARFDALAGDWDAVRDQLLGGRPTHAELAALVLPRALCIVDAGTGTGVHLPELAALAGPGGRVVGVERSSAMAARARRRAEGLANVEVRRGTIEDLPVDDGWADVVLLSLSLGHVEDVTAALRRCARAARPGGRIVVADVERHLDAAIVDRLGPGFRGFDADDLLRTMSAAGLEGARRVEPLPERRGDPRPERRRRRVSRLIPLLCVGFVPETRRPARRAPSRSSP